MERFCASLSAVLPHLDPGELRWRFHFMVGSMAFTLATTDLMADLSHGLCNGTDVEGNMNRLVQYVTGGLQAPATSHADHLTEQAE